MTIFGLTNDGKKWYRFFYFEIERVPSELLLPSAKKFIQERLNWPGRLSGPLILGFWFRVRLLKDNSMMMINSTYFASNLQKNRKMWTISYLLRWINNYRVLLLVYLVRSSYTPETADFKHHDTKRLKNPEWANVYMHICKMFIIDTLKIKKYLVKMQVHKYKNATSGMLSFHCVSDSEGKKII